MKEASVIITVYNRLDYISDAVNSVINQKGVRREDIEIIIVTNTRFSSPGYAVDKVIYSEDRGVGQKLLEGIKSAQSDVIFFLEDDDIFLENKLASVLPLFGEYGVSYVHNAYSRVTKLPPLLVNQDEPNLPTKKINHTWLESKSSVSFFKEFWTYAGNMSSIAVRKDGVDLSFLPKIKLFPDIYMFPIALLLGKDCIHTDKVLTWMREHENSITYNLFKPELYKLYIAEANSWLEYVSGKSKNLEVQAHGILAKRKILTGNGGLNIKDIYYLLLYEMATRMLINDVKSYLLHETGPRKLTS
jgi:glycosyltransferase involved in cell wall biosynthesis